MTLPFVSCLMPTYNRFPAAARLAEEAVESFLRQDYPADRRELVVLNDAPGQELACDAPGVRVVNAPRRYPTLGDKRNALVALARGDVLLPWDDDDVSLPHRLSQAAHMLAGGAGYWNPRHYWFWLPREGLHAPSSLGYAHNCSAFTREAFAAAGGYPPVSGSEDRDMDARLRRAPGVRVRDGLGALAPPEWPYVYRWGVSPHHLSGVRDHDAHYEAIGRRPVAAGRFAVRPGWRHDWAALTVVAAQGGPARPHRTAASGAAPAALG